MFMLSLVIFSQFCYAFSDRVKISLTQCTYTQLFVKPTHKNKKIFVMMIDYRLRMASMLFTLDIDTQVRQIKSFA